MAAFPKLAVVSLARKIIHINTSAMSLIDVLIPPRFLNSEKAQSYQSFNTRFPGYEATTSLDELRQTEYPQLQKQKHIYLDFTGGNLVPRCLIRQHMQLLEQGIYGNPHSTNPASQLSTWQTAEARLSILRYFRAEEDYLCIFTANASGALKIVGETYPFNHESFLLLSLDNHNSVNGIREYAKQKGAAYQYCQLEPGSLFLDEEQLVQQLKHFSGKENKLFAFPAQSNVSGIRHPLRFIELAKENGWDVLLDAAAYVPTNTLDLTQVRPDFVSVSFYKMFGYPTGIGCLLVRKSVYHKMIKPWYAGGTITLSSANYDGHFLKNNEERFEDGTINYLNIPAVKNGLAFLQSIGTPVITRRIQCLAEWLIHALSSLIHYNGEKLVRIFGSTDGNCRGGTIVMNFFNSKGAIIPFWVIEEAANKKNISIRTGCFCNPGLDETNNQINVTDLQHYFGSREQGDYFDMIQHTGKIRGSVRVSLGLVSNFDDVYSFYEFARNFLDTDG